MTIEQKNNFLANLSPIYKSNPTMAKLGLAFTLLPILILIPGLIIISSINTEYYQKYDLDKIDKEGKLFAGKITEIQVDRMFTVNDEHPRIISYTFNIDNNKFDDKMKVLDPDVTFNMKVGDAVDVKSLGKESKLVNIKAFVFPFSVFFILPLIFLILGMIFLTVLVIKYKNAKRIQVS
ncbi:hypothetical protein [Pedobacter sandarakinus]|uniref:hypothetical protein n=1 Tax=Pedobacter sandarakinus TaxID=353156 RepID=UPI0022478572|nr:hypothetical protein [Pedobacter sandarakinus]MCX2576359.1 hypothetical protein [Pedobacter sandarakinus]